MARTILRNRVVEKNEPERRYHLCQVITSSTGCVFRKAFWIGMIPVIDKLVDSIRTRKKAEWQDFFLGYITAIRDFVRSNGEKGAFLGFAVGIVLILFFKLVLIVGCIAALAYLLIIIIADA
jgi:hypothetical protein